MRRGLLLPAVAVALAFAACGTGPTAPPVPPTSPVPSADRPAGPSSGTHSPADAPEPDTAPALSATPTAPPPSTSAPPAEPELPLGGRAILDHARVVAYYGGPGGPGLGILGSAPPEQMVAQIRASAQQYAGFGLPVQPAMELITTVAQAAPGADGLYSKPIPLATVQHYAAVAAQYKMLLILDFQPGRGEFLPQVQRFAAVLADPDVSVALDPEWKVGPDQVPARVIGSASAAAINAVGAYLSGIVAAHDLPDKLMLVHQFRSQMLPDRSDIAQHGGVEVVLHADGFGTQAQKLATWRALAFPGRPFGAGFKLFLRQDTDLMSPAQVMQLVPRPDVVTYQ
ncbi:MAG: hypothetical protein EPN43_09875 [Jatrophihabitans sp.]|nr:MAG: hypothetical protein EPN43_09875 [Jatrophihabitans sp.]